MFHSLSAADVYRSIDQSRPGRSALANSTLIQTAAQGQTQRRAKLSAGRILLSFCVSQEIICQPDDVARSPREATKAPIDKSKSADPMEKGG